MNETTTTRRYPTEYDSAELCPIETTLATLEIVSDPQMEQLKRLIQSYGADRALIGRDSWGTTGNVFFALYRGRESNLNGLIINGVMEPDGRTHT